MNRQQWFAILFALLMTTSMVAWGITVL